MTSRNIWKIVLILWLFVLAILYLYIARTIEYSVMPKTGRPVWRTGRKSVRISNRPVIGRPVVISLSGFQTHSKSGHLCPDFGRFNRTSKLLSTGHPITGHLCPDFRRSRPKPVPNRFGTGFGTGSPVGNVWNWSEIVSNRTSDTKRVPKPVSALERLKSGQYCPVIGRPVPIASNRTSEIWT